MGLGFRVQGGQGSGATCALDMGILRNRGAFRRVHTRERRLAVCSRVSQIPPVGPWDIETFWFKRILFGIFVQRGHPRFRVSLGFRVEG